MKFACSVQFNPIARRYLGDFRHSCAARWFSPTRLSPADTAGIFSQLDCSQAMGIKVYTLADQGHPECSPEGSLDCSSRPWPAQRRCPRSIRIGERRLLKRTVKNQRRRTEKWLRRKTF